MKPTLRPETSPSDGARGASPEIQMPESAGQSDTPETSAFMNLIDDSEIDLGVVESKLSDFERQRDEARAERDQFKLQAKLAIESCEILGALRDKLTADLAIVTAERDEALAGIKEAKKSLREAKDAIQEMQKHIDSLNS